MFSSVRCGALLARRIIAARPGMNRPLLQWHSFAASQRFSASESWRSTVDKFFFKVGPDMPQIADFNCPISSQPMVDPVTAEDGFTYERKNITRWLTEHGTSPMTRKLIGKDLKPNLPLQMALHRFVEDYQFCKELIPGSRLARPDIEWEPHGFQQEPRKIEYSKLLDAAQQSADVITDMSAEMSRAFQALDPIRELLQTVLDDLTPPKIVVIGDESAGKSTVLEQLAMLPVFPRSRRRCTRVAIHVRLRRSPDFSARLYMQPALVANHSEQQETLEKVSEEREEISEDGTCNAPEQDPTPQQPLVIPIMNGFKYVQHHMGELIDRHGKNGFLSDRILVLEVHHPDVPSIDLVDLPGLKTVPQDEAEVVNEILRMQLQEDQKTGDHSMYLAVVPADSRPNASVAMGAVLEHGLSSKTFGVLTKCDLPQVDVYDELRSRVTGSEIDGESAVAVGYVSLDKGWCATMLKTPAHQIPFYFEHHNYERLYMQRQVEEEFFNGTEAHEILRDLSARGAAGTGALARRLVGEYYKYLNAGWKVSAMRKICAKLDAKEFERNMLGVYKPQDKTALAVEEVQKRWGPGSHVVGVYTKFLGTIADRHVELLNEFSQKSDVTVASQEVNPFLQGLESSVSHITKDVSQYMWAFWAKELENLLTAEIKVESANKDGKSVFTVLARFCGTRIQWVVQNLTLHEVHSSVRKQPFIQLSQYPDYTSALILRCKKEFDAAALNIMSDMDILAKRLVEPGSKWLSLTPEENCTKVHISLDHVNLSNSITAVFQRHTPSPKELQTLHEGVSIGHEASEAVAKRQALDKEIQQIEHARDGICKALAISNAEFAQLREDYCESLRAEQCSSAEGRQQ